MKRFTYMFSLTLQASRDSPGHCILLRYTQILTLEPWSSRQQRDAGRVRARVADGSRGRVHRGGPAAARRARARLVPSTATPVPIFYLARVTHSLL